MFTNLLKQGKKITIYDKNGVYVPTQFFFKDKKIYYNNRAIGGGVHDDFTDANALFEKHVEKMLKDGMQISIEG